MNISIRQSKKNTKSMVIRSERFVNLAMYLELLTTNGFIEALLFMRQKTNESLMKSKRSTWKVLTKVTGGFEMIWTDIMTFM
jgi:hypothetical protein